MPIGDAELLGEFVRHGAQDAFAQIVHRYVDLVHASAIRQVRSEHVADDVTQAVFIILARRARSVRSEYLAGWLMRTTRFCARDAVKLRARREKHEKHAATLRTGSVMPADEPMDEQLRPVLDDAISRLRPKESSAVAMRFLRGMSTAEVASTMGITQDAAQKIIARSLVKLRRILTSRNITLSTAGLSGMLLQFGGHKASDALAGTITSTGAGAGASAASLSIARGATRFMWLSSGKAIAALLVFLMLVFGAGALQVHRALTASSPVAVTQIVNVLPFGSPFLELVGCRLKPTIPRPANGMVSGKKDQYFEIEWSRLAVDAETRGYDLVVLPEGADANDPTQYFLNETGIAPQVRSVVYGQTPSRRLMPGRYRVRLSETFGGLEIASLVLNVQPLRKTLITFYDLQSGDSMPHTTIWQELNPTPITVDRGHFQDDPGSAVQSIVDNDGRPVQLMLATNSPTEPNVILNTPVAPGDPILLAVNGVTRPGAVRLDDGTFAVRVVPKNDARTFGVIRLPVGATLVEPDSKTLPTRIVDGRVQVFVSEDKTASAEEFVVRYKLESVSSTTLPSSRP